MIYYYRLHKKLLFSTERYNDLPEIKIDKISPEKEEYIYFLKESKWRETNSFVSLIHPDQISNKREEISILQNPGKQSNDFNIFPAWINEKIIRREVGVCCKNYPRWEERLKWRFPVRWKINIIGLGNVGGTLLTALRLLGGGKIREIGIFDTNEKALSRWEQEVNQISDGSQERVFPEVVALKGNEIFQADMVVFCVSIGVPSADKEVRDARMMQLEANSGIINYYAQKARNARFNGIFAVVSDPVDLLCQSAFLASNYNENGFLDGKGLSSDQIRGFGLGVMNGRAIYNAQKDEKTKHYLKKGRVFGPHGKGLIVADNVEHYEQGISSILTEKVLNANMELRRIGYVPYIAPAISSGALSILALISGKWHYSAGFMGGIFWGSRNRQRSVNLEWEQYNIPKDLMVLLKESYALLKKQSKKLEK